MAPDFQTCAVNHPEKARRRQARDWFLKTLEYASICGCEHVTTLPGVDYDDEPEAASYARCAEELAWRMEQAQKQGIVFGVEAHVGSIVPDPGSAEALMKSVPGLTLTLDYTAETLLPFASHFHVRGARPGRLQASFQENVIDYARVARALDARGYRGWVGIEYVWIDWEHCNECDNLSETILFRDFFRSAGSSPVPQRAVGGV
jgi:sugar phosphate isomerase/epimerase